jgi:hypothetical protein
VNNEAIPGGSTSSLAGPIRFSSFVDQGYVALCVNPPFRRQAPFDSMLLSFSDNTSHREDKERFHGGILELEALRIRFTS